MKKIIALVLCVCLSVFVFAACDTDDMMGESGGTGNTQRTSDVNFTTPRATSSTPMSTSDGGIIGDVSDFVSDLTTDATDRTDTSDVPNGSGATDPSGASGSGRNRDNGSHS